MKIHWSAAGSDGEEPAAVRRPREPVAADPRAEHRAGLLAVEDEHRVTAHHRELARAEKAAALTPRSRSVRARPEAGAKRTSSRAVTSRSALPSGDHTSERGFAYRATTATRRGAGRARRARRTRAAAGRPAARPERRAPRPASAASPVPSPATTRSCAPLRYATRVSVREPPQRGNATFGRASDQCTVAVARLERRELVRASRRSR